MGPMNNKIQILITNDDGIEAKGLWHLWQALADFAELTIVAPSTEKSGVGVGLTLRDPLTIRSVRWDKNTPAWKVNGTPADCVRLAISVILKQKPDLIVSGINRGSNAGRNVLYSGTIGGVIEGALRGVPGVAFSCEQFDDPQYHLAEKHVQSIVRHIIKNPLSKGTILNVNFPDANEIRGVKLARQGKGYWIEDPQQRMHPDGDLYYWHGGKWHDHEEHEESDVALLKQGYAAAVPIHIDELTDHHFLNQNKDLFDQLF